MVPGDTQGQTGQSSEQPGLDIGDSAHCRGVGIDYT